MSAVLRNMQHLCNLLRPAQARQTLLHTLQREVEQRRAAAAELRWVVPAIGALGSPCPAYPPPRACACLLGRALLSAVCA